MRFEKPLFRALLSGVAALMKLTALRYPSFKRRLKEKNLTAQIKLADDSAGRYFIFENGRVTSRSGIHPRPDTCMIYRDPGTALRTMGPWRDQLEQVNALKEFIIQIEGPDELSLWFAETLSMMQTIGTGYGTEVGGGVKRYVSCTNGGAVFVYVKNGKILRVTPIEFDEADAEPWSIEARGRSFAPPRKSTVSPYALAIKSLVYSPDRILYPMKRVDFDPDGERNHRNRGVSGYERISWDEALDLVAGEIKRVKGEYGQGAIMSSTGSHHMWGNLGYHLSAHHRFFNLLGYTPVLQNPDSWEGWYWGAMHHWGMSTRVGGGEGHGLVEDALEHCEMMVFWSSDPEATSGCYSAMEGSIRRQWAKQVGIKFVHIDPFYNHTAAFLGGKWIAPRPATSHALAFAIAYVWITEGLYDQEYVAKRTTGFDQWKDYILGLVDGVPKTPEWQEKETTVPAKDVRALAREWASKKTYLAAGGAGMVFGGACRNPTGIEWARCMVCLMAMQGLGKPGINMGSMQAGTPMDRFFVFPGYAEGGLSGSIEDTGIRVRMYNRMPQLPTQNTSQQIVPRIALPEAIEEGHCEFYPSIRPLDAATIEGQFTKLAYPAPGHSPVKMYYKYGGSFFGTQSDSNRYVKSYRTGKLEFVVNQSIWFEGETKFADVVLPACTSLERWDISEVAHAGGYGQDSFGMLNHRIITLQHKCIEPLGESKSDFQIFLELAKRLGFGPMFSEASTEFEWVKRAFDATDLPRVTSWKKFLEKGYYVVPPLPRKLTEGRVAYRWFAEGKLRNLPELGPLAGDYNGQIGDGLQTQSGKIEFVSNSLMRFDPDDPERPPMPSYIPSFEGPHDEERFARYPLHLISPHPRFSFHTQYDGKDCAVNDVKDHRVLIGGYYYWIVRINRRDAEERGIEERELVRVFNDRGSVICAAQLTQRLPRGTVHSYESCATYDPVGEPGASPDRGGCVNLLTNKRPIISRSNSTAASTCLVQIEKWRGEQAA